MEPLIKDPQRKGKNTLHRTQFGSVNFHGCLKQRNLFLLLNNKNLNKNASSVRLGHYFGYMYKLCEF